MLPMYLFDLTLQSSSGMFCVLPWLNRVFVSSVRVGSGHFASHGYPPMGSIKLEPDQTTFYGMLSSESKTFSHVDARPTARLQFEIHFCGYVSEKQQFVVPKSLATVVKIQPSGDLSEHASRSFTIDSDARQIADDLTGGCSNSEWNDGLRESCTQSFGFSCE
jgi:hypothetical protein